MKKGRPLKWIGSAHKDWVNFPEEVQDVLGYAMHQIQNGMTPGIVEPLNKGALKGLSIFELKEDFYTDTYRGVYTVKFKEVVYVLHAFKRKSKKGKATPQSDIELIKQRFKIAEQDYEENYGKK